MDSKRKKKLEDKGCVAGDTSDFLQLTAEEAGDPAITVDLLLKTLLNAHS